MRRGMAVKAREGRKGQICLAPAFVGKRKCDAAERGPGTRLSFADASHSCTAPRRYFLSREVKLRAPTLSLSPSHHEHAGGHV